MTSNRSDMPLSSLRPLPVGGRKPKNLGEFIARVQADRGFRNVTEDSLREEIRTKAEGQQKEDEEDAQMIGADHHEDDDEEALDINAVRADILRNIDLAHNAAMVSLDFVSLLLSKHNPNQAAATLSQALREIAGIGTLGVSKFKDSMQEGDKKKRQEREKEAKDTALGWTLMDIEQTKKAAEKVTSNLSKEVEKERTYWKEVLAVKQNGWSVCRLPNERHTLGVRFGFTEASPEFRNKSLAPLRRGDDGSVILEQARTTTGRQRVSVDVARSGGDSITGHSAMASSAPDAAALQTRVLEARNTIFSQELWQELHREAHTLASYGVRANDDNIVYEPKAGPKMTLALGTLLKDTTTTEPSRPDDKLAELTQLSLHLLLSYAHRQNEVQRLRPAPPNVRRHQQFNQCHLIRPIISRTLHDVAVRQCTRFVGDMTRLLHQAGIPSATFTLSNPQLPVSELVTAASSSSSSRPTVAQTLINILTSPADFQIEVALTPTARVQIRGRTRFLPLTTTQYQVNLLPSESSGGADPPTNPLHTSYPPYRDGYPDLNSLKSYLLSAVPRSLVDAYLPRFQALSVEQKQEKGAEASQETPAHNRRNTEDADDSGSDGEDPEAPTWAKSIPGTSIQDSANETRQVTFELVEKSSPPTAASPPGERADTTSNEYHHGVELLVSAAWQVTGNGTGTSQSRAKTWRYDGGDRGDQGAPPTIDAIVRAVAMSEEAP